MNCREVLNNLSAYADGELPGAQRRVMEEHLNQCQKCKEELNYMQGVANWLRGIDRHAPGERVWQLACFKIAVDKKAAALASRKFVPMLLAAGVIICVLAGLLVSAQLQPPQIKEVKVFVPAPSNIQPVTVTHKPEKPVVEVAKPVVQKLKIAKPVAYKEVASKQPVNKIDQLAKAPEVEEPESSQIMIIATEEPSVSRFCGEVHDLVNNKTTLFMVERPKGESE